MEMNNTILYTIVLGKWVSVKTASFVSEFPDNTMAAVIFCR